MLPLSRNYVFRVDPVFLVINFYIYPKYCVFTITPIIILQVIIIISIITIIFIIMATMGERNCTICHCHTESCPRTPIYHQLCITTV